MFGHQDNNDQTNQTDMSTAVDNTLSSSSPVAMEQPVDVVTPEAAPTPSTAPLVDPSNPAAAAHQAAASGTNDLLDLKQSALQQLSPLLGHLDQTPEEKFRTTMMMIQASDNQSLLQSAYEAAQRIGDEKTRAQALLDIVNEINYFTQQHEA